MWSYRKSVTLEENWRLFMYHVRRKLMFVYPLVNLWYKISLYKIQKKYENSKLNWIDSIYVDQGFNYGPYVSSGYTSYGISQIDSEFSNRIRGLERYDSIHKKKAKKILYARIALNDNLHFIIKGNLLKNLKSI